MTTDKIRQEAKQEAESITDNLSEALTTFDTGRCDTHEDAVLEMKRQSRKFVEYLDDKDELSNRQSPKSVASGAVHAAAACLDLFTSLQITSDHADVSDSTVQRYYGLIRDHLHEDYKSGPAEVDVTTLAAENNYLVEVAYPMNLWVHKEQLYMEAMNQHLM